MKVRQGDIVETNKDIGVVTKAISYHAHYAEIDIDFGQYKRTLHTEGTIKILGRILTEEEKHARWLDKEE